YSESRTTMLDKKSQPDFKIELQKWIKLQIRMSTLERNKPKLNYKFEFENNISKILCHIYFMDVESNPLSSTSAKKQKKIQDSWIALAMNCIYKTLRSSHLPTSYHLNIPLKLTLH